MKRFLLLLGLSVCINTLAQPKREFRGAWIQCVNGQFQGLGTEKMQQTLAYQLDELQKTGVNAIIFQVRPECDALYQSSIEPWSRFLTGQQGRAPQPWWDPLEWMVSECHKRNMELHAWINPYRAKTKGTTQIAVTHIAATHPERCFSYDEQLILNPALPENRDYICQVARDIVTRYDVDGIHIDDYFYPYPVAGATIPDDAQHRQYGNGIADRGDWRRHNVNLFVKQFYETVHQAKPWVKVGISPFGIYRNKKNAGIGSETNGLQNYDDLYADVLLWVNNGWLDYCVPQIYWEIGNRAADYATLIRWWDRCCGNRPLYIGEDIERTVANADPKDPSKNQQEAKRKLYLQTKNVKGSVLWYAKAAVDNTGNYATMLRQNYWRYPALMPQMTFIDKKAPGKPRHVKVLDTNDGPVLFWTEPRGRKWDDKGQKYVVYRFARHEKINTDDPAHIVAVTRETFYRLPHVADDASERHKAEKFTYVVTALDRMENESKPVKKKVTLNTK